MKRVLILSDVRSGGAAIACQRLLAGLRKGSEMEVQWTASVGDTAAESVVASQWPSLFPLLRYRVAMRFSSSEVAQRKAEVKLNEANVLQSIRRFKPDLINVHNIHATMSFSLVERLPADTPLVWTLHDMWPLTGYCCHSYDCEKYRSGCEGNCPQLGKWEPAMVEPSREWQRRQSFFEDNRHRVVLVAPSRWLADRAKERFGELLRVEWIPNGVDLEVFKPVADKSVVRHALGLPPGKRVILSIAHFFESECKGKEYLVRACEALRTRVGNVFVVVVVGSWKVDTRPVSSQWIFRNSLKDEELLNLYCNAADVFVLPSVAENLPNTLLEAMAAGTPSVVFRVGGCPEVVRDGETGFVAEPRNHEDLAAGLERVLALSEEQKRRMRQNCRQIAEEEYAVEVQAKRYQTLFDGMIGGKVPANE